MTGLSLFRTSASKVASVTGLVAPTVQDFLPWMTRARAARGGADLGLVISKPPLRIERGGTASPGSRDRLPVDVVDHVAGREDAVDRGAGAGVIDQEVTLRVDRQLPGEELTPGVVANGHEQPGDRQNALLAGLDVPQPQARDPVLAQHLFHHAVPGELDLRVRGGPILHDLGRAQAVPAVDDGDRLGEPGQEGRLLQRRVAAADYRDLGLAEEEPVTGSTPGHAVPGQPLLARCAELAVPRAGGDNH